MSSGRSHAAAAERFGIPCGAARSSIHHVRVWTRDPVNGQHLAASVRDFARHLRDSASLTDYALRCARLTSPGGSRQPVGKDSNCRSIYCYALAMATYIPPGWPTGVHPPGSDDFEATAVAWLLDVVPPDYRLHGVLRRHPMALAVMARHHTAACVEGARQGYRTARTELAEALPPHAVDAVLTAYRTEGRRLAATARAVALVERAMRGEAFTRKL